MSAEQLLSFISQVVFLLLGIATTIDYLRHRDRIRRDVALMFGSLAIPMVSALVRPIIELPTWLASLFTITLLAQPFLITRMINYFQSVPQSLPRIALFGMLASLIIFIAYTSTSDSMPPAIAFIIVVYFVIFNGYAMYAFIHGAVVKSGVVRQRLRFAAAGSGILALALAVAGVAGLVPALQTISSGAVQLLGGISALSFYIGFLPPRWLRRMWQFEEQRNFLKQIEKHPLRTGLTLNDILDELCRTANRTTGGKLSLVLTRNDTTESWQIVSASHEHSLDIGLLNEKSAVYRAWQDQSSRIIQAYEGAHHDDLKLLKQSGAETLLIVPILTTERTLGILLLFTENILIFPDDDLELLRLITQQGAIFLENAQLLEQVQSYSEDLEQKVKERTEALYQLNEELEQRVLDRTALLEAANKELEAFSYSVSHDLRAPLRALDGFSQALLEDYHDIIDDEGQEYLGLLRSESQRMGDLIDDLLDLSRLTRTDLNRKTVNMSKIAQRISQELQTLAPDRDVKFLIEEDLLVCADEHLLTILLQNLLENAWKYSNKKDNVCIEIGYQCQESQLEYFVRDNGVGFDMQYVQKLFGAFQRLHSQADFEGTGIGLATVQRIVHRHGGAIRAMGVVDEGATFYFDLGNETCD